MYLLYKYPYQFLNNTYNCIEKMISCYFQFDILIKDLLKLSQQYLGQGDETDHRRRSHVAALG